MATTDEQDFERLQRMSEQTHPDILPLCIETLDMRINHIDEQVQRYEITDTESRLPRRICSALAKVALTASMADSIIALGQGRTFSGPETIAVWGCIIVSYRLSKMSKRMAGNSKLIDRLKDSREKFSTLRQTAYQRAVDMEIISPDEEQGMPA